MLDLVFIRRLPGKYYLLTKMFCVETGPFLPSVKYNKLTGGEFSCKRPLVVDIDSPSLLAHNWKDIIVYCRIPRMNKKRRVDI
jgi:hypothetical protein